MKISIWILTPQLDNVTKIIDDETFLLDNAIESLDIDIWHANPSQPHIETQRYLQILLTYEQYKRLKTWT